MRPICPPGACNCGAQGKVELTTPIQLVGPKQIERLTAGQVIGLFRQSGVYINTSNIQSSVSLAGVCRLTREAVIKKLSNETNPDNDPIHYWY